MMLLAWNWLRKNFNLVLLLAASTCLVLTLDVVVRGALWSLFLPISFAAVACGWGLGASRLKPKQAWGSLIGLGIPGVLIYVGGLGHPLGRLILSVFFLIPQFFSWMSDRTPVDFDSLLINWTELTKHLAGLFTRMWTWWGALIAGHPFADPLAAGLVWSTLLWFVGVWGGWQLMRNRKALQALVPGGILLTLVLDYTRGDSWPVVIYLTILLTLMGITKNEWRHVGWQQRRVDYAESIAIDTLVMVGMVTAALVMIAAGTPSFSWRELVKRFQGTNQTAVDRAAESLGLERPKNVANNESYRSGGLPRSHLLDSPPEVLQDVALTISTGELPPIPEMVTDIHPNRYYWRTITYDIYTGSGWGSSAAVEEALLPDTSLLTFLSDYRSVTQHVKRGQDMDTNLYWTGTLAQADAKVEIAWRTKPPDNPVPTNSGDMLGALTEPDEYTVVSYVPQFNADQLRSATSDYPPQISGRYLQLPDSVPERVLAKARELTQAAPTPYDRAIAIESYLRTFPYTLDIGPPPPGRDVVDYFLFTAQRGYCDYYATSMVVLARAVGLPARLVIGYANGHYNQSTAEYIVRQADAHSWVEVYFSGIGWVEFEPTAGQPAIDRLGDGAASGTPPSLPGRPSVISRLKDQWRILISTLGGQLIIAGISMILLFILWQIGNVGFLYLLPSQRAISRIYARMEQASMRLLPDLPDGRTPYQLRLALTHKLASGQNPLQRILFSKADREIERVVSLYVAQVFSEHLPTKTQVRTGIWAWMRLRWRLWIANGWIRYLPDRLHF